MTTRHRQRYVLGAAIVLVLALVIAPVSAASRAKASIWIENSGARAPGADLAFGDLVTFGYTSSYSDATGGTGPWLELLCSQNGQLVYVDRHAGFAGGIGYGEPFVLGGSVGWQSGSADCQASVGHIAKRGNYVADAAMTFAVTP